MVWPRFLVVPSFLIVLAAPLAAQTGGPEWEPGGRKRAYMSSLIGPGALISLAATSGIETAREDPPEWGDDLNGFGKRFASNAGRNVIQQSVRHGVSAAFDRSVVYQKCECNSMLQRTGHAFVETVTDRDRQGSRMISVSRFLGAFAGAYAEQQWRPDRSGSEAAAVALSTVVFGTLGNLWREFIGWP